MHPIVSRMRVSECGHANFLRWPISLPILRQHIANVPPTLYAIRHWRLDLGGNGNHTDTYIETFSVSYRDDVRVPATQCAQ